MVIYTLALLTTELEKHLVQIPTADFTQAKDFGFLSYL